MKANGGVRTLISSSPSGLKHRRPESLGFVVPLHIQEVRDTCNDLGGNTPSEQAPAHHIRFYESKQQYSQQRHRHYEEI